ncbi:MAG: ATP-grasp fold amidoligase family protein [Aquabacterium sp.]|uniref:ATP-grasp fold amidoligase family protein n=1 Tax=Aquabacterium sp. TaxID=1872578 RepID=UPI003BE0A034
MTFKEKFRLVRSGAYFEARRQLKQLRSGPQSPWQRACRPGHMRGIDYYGKRQLIWVVANAMQRYRRSFGCYPNMAHPTTFNDKIMWLKFFGELRVPESGNKLATASFIPPSLTERLTCAPLAWQGGAPSLPLNDALPEGVYYLKATHGSGMFERLCYPLDAERRAQLESMAARWLAHPFGVEDGEWWYNTFAPQLILERSVTGDEDSISWNFYVVNGQVPMVGLFLKSAKTGEEFSTWLGADLKPLPWQHTLPEVPGYVIGPQQHEMLSFALEIAKPFSAVRVDFLQGSDGKTYLCELTFSPGNAMTWRPPEVDSLLSTPWTEL